MSRICFNAPALRPHACLIWGAIILVAACSEAAGPTPSPLEGLIRVETNDTVGLPPNPSPFPGSFHGYFLGYTPGPDTLATAEPIKGATVRAYEHVVTAADGVGPLAASEATDTYGLFRLPVLPPGEYIVTFTPPDSKYRGAWTLATASATSNQYPWWILVPPR